MGLSEQERKLLEELEKPLGEPSAVRAAPFSATERGPRRLLAGLLIAVIGLITLVSAVVARLPILGLAAFLVMGAGLAVASSRKSG